MHAAVTECAFVLIQPIWKPFCSIVSLVCLDQSHAWGAVVRRAGVVTRCLVEVRQLLVAQRLWRAESRKAAKIPSLCEPDSRYWRVLKLNRLRHESIYSLSSPKLMRLMLSQKELSTIRVYSLGNQILGARLIGAFSGAVSELLRTLGGNSIGR
jgi:hypothetical protein